MTFPPETRLAMGFTLALVFACLLGILWRQDRRGLALRDWSLACLLIALGAPLRILPEAWPDWLRIAASNALLVQAFACFWAGARHFRERPPHPAGRFAGLATWLALLPWVIGSTSQRVSLVSAAVGLYALLTAREFIQGMRAGRLPSYPLLAAIFAAFGAVSFGRSVLAFAIGFDPVPHTALPAARWNDYLAVAMLACFAGMVVMLVAITREQAERLSTARLTAARDRADAASHNKTRFLARMSHELRTPLNAVYGMAQVLARDQSLGPVQREQARLLVEAGSHLLAIVNDALDLARVEAGRLDLAPEPVALPEALQATLALVAAAAAAKRQDLRFETETPLPAMVVADPLRLRQIAMNLLGNATKFTPPGGRITLSAGWEAGELRLIVTDTGPGLPAGVLADLFGDFVQGPRQTDGVEGSGLGLAICAALARAMGGTLRHAPGPEGVGASFTLALPAPELPREPGRPLRLLVVDDVLVNRKVARALLEPAGHSVEEAADGQSALAALQAGPLPDAVLMDVQMQPLDGLAATRMLRALGGEAARLPVIALTGSVDPAEQAACRAAGMDGHLSKPIERVALLAELARVTLAQGAAARSLHGEPAILRSSP
ncbi:ATP-binding protein [Belnapia rosea]|uniref:histidine kinase n=1 Tax=Belnapia rosea TaxID=938405 RepID=A0A1G6QWY4_9PROT|nr:ATP-binding protein [Belnapia rosea]SDC96267.1 Signal transduction histidine kinase [Belnapia rosea]